MRSPDFAGLKRSLGFWDLVLYNVVILINARWLAAAASAGSDASLLWLSGILFFFVPSAILITGMSVRYPREGGFYYWIQGQFGDWVAFWCGWLYALGILFYFPTTLIYALGSALTIASPSYKHLVDQPSFMLPALLLALWSVVIANLLGLDVAKWIYNAGGAANVLTVLLMLGAAVALYRLRDSATPLMPTFTMTSETLNLSAQLLYGLTGFELAGILAGEIRDPVRILRRSAYLASAFVCVFYVAGTLSLLVVVPANQIRPDIGLAHAAQTAGAQLAARWFAPLLAALVALGLAGNIGSLFGTAARLPYVFGIDRYFPASFGKTHPRWATPYVAILWGGVLSTLFVAAMFAGETMRAGFQLLMDMAILANAVPFLLLFAAGFKAGFRWSGLLGGVFSLGMLVFSCIPPAGVDSLLRFEAKLIGGLALLSAAAWLLYRRVGLVNQLDNRLE
ncbi:MAG: APC family permease [Acidobacteria bacterium]|nr:APC family permease [Acidobacteriota bacterium]